MEVITIDRVHRSRVLDDYRRRGSSIFVLWLAAIQGIERNEGLANLAPKGSFIAAEAIEREVGQISKTQKATRELNASGLMVGRIVFGSEFETSRWWPRHSGTVNSSLTLRP